MSTELYGGRRFSFHTLISDRVQTGPLRWRLKTHEEQIVRSLSLLGPDNWSAYILWPAPPGIGHLDLKRDDVQPITFMQAGGPLSV